jgi:hypothetical protein
MYFTVDMSTVNAGLSHQISNLMVLIRYCYDKNHELVVPSFHLTGKHNNGKSFTSQFAEYIDYSTLAVDGHQLQIELNECRVNPAQLIRVERKEYEGGLLRTDPMFMNISNYHVTYTYKKYLIDIGNSVSELLGCYTCVHVRRGDRLNSAQMDTETSPANILRIIKQCENRNVYIMTDEVPDFFEPLLAYQEFNIMFYQDFTELEALKHIDNYKLFTVENIISKNANKRVSTFRTPDPSYDFYLTSAHP